MRHQEKRKNLIPLFLFCGFFMLLFMLLHMDLQKDSSVDYKNYVSSYQEKQEQFSYTGDSIKRDEAVTSQQLSQNEYATSAKFERAEKESISFLYHAAIWFQTVVIPQIHYSAIGVAEMILFLTLNRIIIFIYKSDGKKERVSILPL